MPPSSTTTVCVRSSAAICSVFMSATFTMCVLDGAKVALKEEHPVTERRNERKGVARLIHHLALEIVECARGQFVPAPWIDGRWLDAVRHAFECRPRILQFCLGFAAVHLAQREHCVPERELPPSVFAVAHRAQVRRALLQSLCPAIEAAGEEVPPQTDAALAATKETRILSARVFGETREALQQPFVGRIERLRDSAVPNAEEPQRARGFLTQDVARGRVRDALASEQHDPVRTLGGK